MSVLKSVARALRVGKVERIDKLLSHRGAGSRREVDILLQQGRVSVNGVVIKKRGEQLSSDTEIRVDGKVYAPIPLLAIFHKPAGIVCTMKDSWFERQDLSSLYNEYPFLKPMHPVGRLDKDTSGLLLFSRDGNLTNSLLLPTSCVEREYKAIVGGEVCGADIAAKMTAGVETSSGVFTAKILHTAVLSPATAVATVQSLRQSTLTRPAVTEAALDTVAAASSDNKHENESECDDDISGNNSSDSDTGKVGDKAEPTRPLPSHLSEVQLIVQEGKHRMVRRMLHNVGHSVLQLCRVRFGELRLGDLPVGGCRAINETELQWVLQFFKRVRVVKKKSKNDKHAESIISKKDPKKSTEVKKSEAPKELFKVIGKKNEQINAWKSGSLGKKGSRRFQ